LPAYRLPSPYERPPLRRRASGLALALAVNLLLLLVLLGLGKFSPVAKTPSRPLVVDLVSEPQAPSSESKAAQHRSNPHEQSRPLPKPPPIVLPSKPTITPPAKPKSQPWIEMSNDELAAGDISSLPKGEPGDGDSEIVGRAPNGDVLYAAEWARRPTDAELGGYLPKNAPDGAGIIACKTVPGERVDDCLEIGNDPPGSHLASAVRQAAWQFRVRPPRKNGHPLIGSWVQIRIDYESIGRSSGG
jgi:periplasmic protein TonB